MEGYRKALELARQDYAAAQSRKAAIDAEIETIEKEMRQLRNLIETLTSLVGEPVDVAAKAPPPRPQRPAARRRSNWKRAFGSSRWLYRQTYSLR